MVDYRFTYNGKDYSFPTERAAKIEAFRVTGKIGAVVISAHYPVVPVSTLKQEHRMTLVRWIIALLLVTVVGMAISTSFVMSVIGAIITVIYMAWPLLVGVSLMWGMLSLIEWWDKKRFADDDGPDTGGAA